ncbi:hypothetical protein QOT17_013610 [Balamuthia mandrillaris]
MVSVTAIVLACSFAALVFPLGAYSQTCVPWDGAPSFCAKFDEWKGTDVHIYVPVNATIAELVSRVSTNINYVGSLGDDGSLDSKCNLFWARLNCATHLRPCARVIGNDGAVLLTRPVQPCLTSCRNYEALCKEYVLGQGLPFGVSLYYPPGHAAPLTCSENDTDGLAFYQSANYSISASLSEDEDELQSYELHCNKLTSDGSGFLQCEEPLETEPGSNNCGFTCPLPSYSQSQYDSIENLQLVLSWLSWAGSLVVILSYALHNKLRQFPSNLILMAAVAAHAESVGMILPTFFGTHNTWCGFDTVFLMPETSIENQVFVIDFDIAELSVESGLCTFQGWLVQMGFLSSTMWWGIVAFNMFLSVFFGKKLPTTKTWTISLQITLHICGWAVPAFLMLVPAAAGQISFAPGASFCSLDAADVYFLVFWAVPIGIILLVGTILFVASLMRLLKFARQLKELKKTCGTYFRVILFILIYLVLITFIFSYSLRVVTAKDTIEDGYGEYYKCLIRRDNNCTLSESVHNYGLAVLRSVGYSSLGLLLFFNFCISPSMGRFWWRFFDKLRQGRFTSIFTSEKTPNTGKSPGKTKKSTGTHDMITMSMDDEKDGDEIIP